jgi:hypothetical protein
VLGKYALVTIVVVTVLTGCGSGDDQVPEAESSPPSSPSSTPTSSPTGVPAVDPCGLLTDGDVEQLAGERLPHGRATLIGGQLPVCVWGSLDDVGVQAGMTEASRWARSLPGIVASLKAAGTLDAQNLRKLAGAADLVESGATIPSGEACELFSALVEVNGLPPGSSWTVNLVPTAQEPRAITGQACRNGTYATALVVRPDLTGPAGDGGRVRRALETLLQSSAP